MTAATPSALSAYRQLLRATRIAFRGTQKPHSPSQPTPTAAVQSKANNSSNPDDTRVLLAARQEARRNFDQNRRVGVDTGMQINHAVEVANILRHNLVQGAREDGNEAAKWGMFFLSILQIGVGLRMRRYVCIGMRAGLTGTELRIHDEIERGDNDSIKVGNKDVKIHKACSS